MNKLLYIAIFFFLIGVFTLSNHTRVQSQQELDSNADGLIDLNLLPSIDEDNMATNSAIKLPTQQSVKAYVDTQVATKEDSITEGSLPNDSVLEEDLKVVNTCSDEEILTRETTTGDFECHSIDEVIIYLSQGLLPDNSVLLGDINSSTRSGSDSKLVTGTAGTSGNCAEWNVDGDLVDAGDVCGSGSGAGDVTAAATFDTDNVLIKSDGTSKGVQHTGITISDDDIINPAALANYGLYDTDGAGADVADKLVCSIKGNFTTTTEDAEYGDIYIECVINGTHTEILRYDASDGQWESNQTFRISNAVDGGLEQLELSANYDIESSEPNVCRKRYVMTTASNANVEFELPSSNTCATGVTKELHFHNGETDNYDLIIDPNGTDQIILNVEGECGAGNPIYCGEEYSEVILYRRTDTAWNAIVTPGVGTCACSSQQ